MQLGKDSSCPVDSKNGQTFENPIIGIGDIGLNVREHEIKKILKDRSILTLLISLFREVDSTLTSLQIKQFERRKCYYCKIPKSSNTSQNYLIVMSWCKFCDLSYK